MWFLLIIIGIALVALSMSGYVSFSWVVGAAVAGLGLIGMLVQPILEASANNSKKFEDGQGQSVNSCGCTGPSVRYFWKPFLGKKRYAIADCSTALNIVNNKPRRAGIVGCV